VLSSTSDNSCANKLVSAVSQDIKISRCGFYIKEKRSASIVRLGSGAVGSVGGVATIDRWQSKLAVCIVEQNDFASMSQLQ
jgi:hypothetical protein